MPEAFQEEEEERQDNIAVFEIPIILRAVTPVPQPCNGVCLKPHLEVCDHAMARIDAEEFDA